MKVKRAKWFWTCPQPIAMSAKNIALADELTEAEVKRAILDAIALKQQQKQDVINRREEKKRLQQSFA